MPVFRNSRYDGSEYIGISFEDGTKKRWVQPQTPMTIDDAEDDWVEHEIESQEELDALALAYGDLSSSGG